MIPTAKSFTNSAQGKFGQFPRKIHGDLTGKRDVFRTTFALHVGEVDRKMICGQLLDEVHGNRVALFLLNHLTQSFFDGFDRQA